jgi:hypothetical protein
MPSSSSCGTQDAAPRTERGRGERHTDKTERERHRQRQRQRQTDKETERVRERQRETERDRERQRERERERERKRERERVSERERELRVIYIEKDGQPNRVRNTEIHRERQGAVGEVDIVVAHQPVKRRRQSQSGTRESAVTAGEARRITYTTRRCSRRPCVDGA